MAAISGDKDGGIRIVSVKFYLVDEIWIADFDKREQAKSQVSKMKTIVVELKECKFILALLLGMLIKLLKIKTSIDFSVEYLEFYGF